MSQIRVQEEHEKQIIRGSEDLRQQFTELSEKKEAYRVVTLKYNSCCGCGCATYDIRRTVPADSSLKDGDLVNEMEIDDEWVD